MENTGTNHESADRPVTLVLKDQDGLDMTFCAINIRTSLARDRIIPAVMAASQDYLNTPEGRKTWEHNGRNFNYGDFDMYVGNEFCIPHGFYRPEMGDVEVVDDDFNTRLAEPEIKTKGEGV